MVKYKEETNDKNIKELVKYRTLTHHCGNCVYIGTIKERIEQQERTMKTEQIEKKKNAIKYNDKKKEKKK